jgi:two-component system nitrate/nitrite response regulator NarL
MPRVVIIAPNRLSRDALAQVLHGSEFEILGSTGILGDAGPTVARYRPDLVLVDLERPDHLVQVLDDVQASNGHAQVVVLAGDRTARQAVAAFQHGARGFLLRDQTRDQLLDGVREVVAGGVVVDPRAAERLVAAATRGFRVSGPYGLSRQEQLVVGHVARRLTNGQIGQEIGVSTSTVKTHLQSAFRKLGVSTRTEAASFALDHGLA